MPRGTVSKEEWLRRAESLRGHATRMREAGDPQWTEFEEAADIAIKAANDLMKEVRPASVSKITPEIEADLAAGKITQSEAARRAGISPQSVSAFVKRRTKKSGDGQSASENGNG